MKPTIENLKDSFKIGYEAFRTSRVEVDRVYNYFHNKQYTDMQLHKIKRRGQPAETYNILKLYARLLLGYYQTVINSVQVQPRKYSDIVTASVLNDLVDYTLQNNNFNSEADRLKLDLILGGLMCCYESVEPTGEVDEFNRPLYEIKLTHIPIQEIVLDPMSRKSDYSDAKYIHRFKWISEEDFETSFGQAKLKEAQAYYNYLGEPDADFSTAYKQGSFNGIYKRADNYLVVHSIIKDGDRSWSVFWFDNIILDKQEITYRKVKNPYRIQKLYETREPEYYGIFRELIETQDAINQALLKIQTMVNTQKALVQRDSLDGTLEDFEDAFNRVNAIIPVKDVAGVQVINLTREVADQYTVIDKGLKRIKEVLGINDAFLGIAYSQDSGKKVQIQQQASIISLKYLSTKIENFYRLLGWDIVNLIQQYFTFHDIIGVADTYNSKRWVEINAPFIAVDKKGRKKYLLEEVLDPETGKPLTDEDGNIVMAPIPTVESDIAFVKADIRIDSVAYNNEQEQSQTLLDSFLNGNLGKFLMNTNPAGYARAGSLALKNMKNKYSPELAEILKQTAEMFEQQQMQAQLMQQQAQQLPEQ